MSNTHFEAGTKFDSPFSHCNKFMVVQRVGDHGVENSYRVPKDNNHEVMNALVTEVVYLNTHSTKTVKVYGPGMVKQDLRDPAAWETIAKKGYLYPTQTTTLRPTILSMPENRPVVMDGVTVIDEGLIVSKYTEMVNRPEEVKEVVPEQPQPVGIEAKVEVEPAPKPSLWNIAFQVIRETLHGSATVH